ncbi:MAG: CDP-alcohol phosphatidyltransferase family protein [Desulfobacteraceae bacterium]|nr:CDP-alcohol phosphatidyltransferase family protein [Desulfobacteraceae bacterium]
MITIYNLKPYFQNCLRPICSGIVNKGITANHVTIVSAVLSVVFGLFLIILNKYQWIFFILPFFMFFIMALNAIDGIIAKEFNMKTPEGAILNELCDVISDIFLYIPFAFIPGISSIIIVIITMLSIITEMAGILAFSIGADRKYDGPIGKSDRAFVFSVVAIAVGFEIDPGLFTVVFLIIIFLQVFTIYNRIKSALKSSGERF